MQTGFDASEREVLLRVARAEVAAAVTGRSLETDARLPEELARRLVSGVFTTLRRAGSLRSCIGHCPAGELPSEGLGDLLHLSASHAAASDTRFPAIHPDELDFLELDISVLSPPAVVAGGAEERLASVRPGKHGLILSHWGGRGLLLPQVASERGWDAETFLESVCLKAGVPARAWREPETVVQTFESEHFADPPRGREIAVRDLERGLPRQFAQALCQGDATFPELTKTAFEFWTGAIASTAAGFEFWMQESGSLGTLADEVRQWVVRCHSGTRQPCSLSLLTHALPLRIGEDGQRRRSLSGSAIWLRTGDGWQALHRSRPGPGDPLAAALKAARLGVRADSSRDLEAMAFQVWPCPNPPG